MDDTPGQFDPLSPEFVADPYRVYADLRGPLLHAGQPGAWSTATHALCLAALRDPRFSSNPTHAGPGLNLRADEGAVVPAVLAGESNLLLFKDPPDHTRLRRLANKAFTPRAVERMRADIVALTTGLLDELAVAGADGGPVDWMEAVARPLPLFVICSMLGIPTEDRARFTVWSDALGRLLDPIDEPAVLEAGMLAGMELAQYFFELAADRRAHPGEDLLTALIRAEDDGDTLAAEELLSLFGLLFVAGHETTTNLLGNGLLALLRNPAQLEILRDEPGLMPGAVEELLRYDAPVQVTGRFATVDIQLGDNFVPKGNQVVLLIAGANRDPEEFENPESLDVRRDARQHLSFSSGMHYCLGASLAKLEGEIVFAELLRRFPTITLVTTDPTYREHMVLRGLSALEITVA